MAAIKISPWWSTTLKSMVGTVIGIILTFGTTAVVNYHKKQQAAHNLCLMVLSNFVDISDQMEQNLAEYLGPKEQVLSVCYDSLAAGYSLDSLSQEDQRIVKYLFLTPPKPIIYDKGPQEIFMSNTETWQNIDNNRFINAVGNLYAFVEYYNTTIEQLYAEHKKVTDEIKMDWDNNSKLKTTADSINLIFTNKHSRNYIRDYRDWYMPLFRMISITLKEMYPRSMEFVNITSEEIEQFRGKREQIRTSDKGVTYIDEDSTTQVKAAAEDTLQQQPPESTDSTATE